MQFSVRKLLIYLKRINIAVRRQAMFKVRGPHWNETSSKLTMQGWSAETALNVLYQINRLNNYLREKTSKLSSQN